MRKSKTKVIIALLMAAAFTVTGCGQSDSDNKDDQSSSVASQEKDNTDSEPDAAEQESPDSAAADSRTLYENFLAGTEKASIEKVDFTTDAWGEEHSPELIWNESYTIDEFFEKFIADRKAYSEDDYSLGGELDYAYIDCGQDGSEELVLQMKSYSYGDEYNNIFVIKDIGGQLAFCTWFCDGYRAYNYINSYGVIGEGGSSGASNWSCNYYSIGDDGEKFTIYESQTCGCYDIYLGEETNLTEAAMDLDVSDMVIERYSFDNYVYDGDLDSYYDHLRNSYYTYGIGYDMSDADTSPEIYDPESKYARFMSNISENVYTPDDMQVILEENLSKLGLTEEMLPEDEISWMKVEGYDDIFAAG